MKFRKILCLALALVGCASLQAGAVDWFKARFTHRAAEVKKNTSAAGVLAASRSATIAPAQQPIQQKKSLRERLRAMVSGKKSEGPSVVSKKASSAPLGVAPQHVSETHAPVHDVTAHPQPAATAAKTPAVSNTRTYEADGIHYRDTYGMGKKEFHASQQALFKKHEVKRDAAGAVIRPHVPPPPKHSRP